MVKECMLSTGKLPLGGLPRNSVVRIADCPDMTSAVHRGRQASNQTHVLPQSAQYHCLALCTKPQISPGYPFD